MNQPIGDVDISVAALMQTAQPSVITDHPINILIL